MDPISAIAKAVGDITSGALGLAQTKRQKEADIFNSQAAMQASMYAVDGTLIQTLTGDDIADKTRNYIIFAIVIAVLMIVGFTIYSIVTA